MVEKRRRWASHVDVDEHIMEGGGISRSGGLKKKKKQMDIFQNSKRKNAKIYGQCDGRTDGH